MESFLIFITFGKKYVLIYFFVLDRPKILLWLIYRSWEKKKRLYLDGDSTVLLWETEWVIYMWILFSHVQQFIDLVVFLFEILSFYINSVPTKNQRKKAFNKTHISREKKKLKWKRWSCIVVVWFES